MLSRQLPRSLWRIYTRAYQAYASKTQLATAQALQPDIYLQFFHNPKLVAKRRCRMLQAPVATDWVKKQFAARCVTNIYW